MRVGPVLRPGEVSAAIIAVLRGANPAVEVIDRGGYLRVQAPRRLRLDRQRLEARLGHAFRLPGDLEQVMPSFAGRLVFSEQGVEWRAD